jgi:hypothetical protein
MSFLGLPAELRFQIYPLIAVPESEPFSVYHGFYSSCRQIKSEIDSKCGKSMRGLLTRIEKEHDCATFMVPTSLSFARLQHVQFCVEKKPSRSILGIMLRGAIKMHLASLTLSTTDPEIDVPGAGGLGLFGAVRIYMSHIICTPSDNNIDPTTTPLVVVILPAVKRTQHRAEDWITQGCYYNDVYYMDYTSVWQFRWALESAKPVKAIWELRPLWADPEEPDTEAVKQALMGL